MEGVLDMDQILQTDPWKQISNFVHHNFAQNILSEFDDRIKKNPKLTPGKDDKNTGEDRVTSSSRKPSKSPKASHVRSLEKKEDRARESRKSVTRDKRSTEAGKQQARNDDKNAKASDKRKSVSKKRSKAESICGWNSTEDQQNVENVSKTNAGTKRISKSFGGTAAKDVPRPERTVTDSRVLSTKTRTSTTYKVDTVASDTSTSINSQLPVDSSTPKYECTRSNNLETKEMAASGRDDVSQPKREPSIAKHTSVEKRPKKEAGVKRERNDSRKDDKQKTLAKRETVNNSKAKRNNNGIESDKTAPANSGKVTASRCNKQNGKNVTTGEKKIGKYERRLLEKRKRREERKIRRHERKAERAFEKFGRHVTKIVQKMGYLPENGSTSSDDSDCSDESSCSCSSCASCDCSCDCSSCDCSSCDCSSGCSSDYSSDYTEYTPCSSSCE